MAKELVLITKVQYEKLISACQKNSSSSHVHTNVNESVGGDSKHTPLLSKPLIRTDEQTNVEPNGERNANEDEYIAKESLGIKPKGTKENLKISRKPKKIKSNSEHVVRDQSGGKQMHRKYLKQTYAEFMANKKRRQWIPYKI